MKKFAARFAFIAVLLAGCATSNNGATYKTSEGGRIEYSLIKNEHSPCTVVFENGLGATMDSWEKVAPEIAESATVYMYNRAGYGASSESQNIRDGENITKELRRSLKELGLKPPYILVGHSLGGLYMQYYARHYPNEVGALVLVDSTHPKQFTGDGSPDNWPAWFRVGFNMTLNDTQENEFALINKTGEEVLAMPTTNTTVIVLSADEPMRDDSNYSRHVRKLRAEIASLYPNSRQVWVESGHNIQKQKPQVVISAIKDAIDVGCK